MGMHEPGTVPMPLRRAQQHGRTIHKTGPCTNDLESLLLLRFPPPAYSVRETGAHYVSTAHLADPLTLDQSNPCRSENQAQEDTTTSGERSSIRKRIWKLYSIGLLLSALILILVVVAIREIE
jgi:hypothetical protein